MIVQRTLYCFPWIFFYLYPQSLLAELIITTEHKFCFYDDEKICSFVAASLSFT